MSVLPFICSILVLQKGAFSFYSCVACHSKRAMYDND